MFERRCRRSIPALLWLLCGCPSAPPAPTQTDRTGPPNILLISLDTTRADHTSPFGSRRDTTPTLAQFAARGVAFNQAFSQANESAYSHASLFTGRYASELAVPEYSTYGIPEDATLASEALRAYGYRTAMFSAGGHVTADYGFNQGWDHYSEQRGFGSLWHTGGMALDWIAHQPSETPFFMFLHSYDAHRPYSKEGFWDHLYASGQGSEVAELLASSPCLSEMVRGDTLYPEHPPTWFEHAGGDQIMDPRTYDRLAEAPQDTVRVPVTEADKQHVQDHYDGSVRYADTMLGIFLAKLDGLGVLDDTVVIITSDHGEDLLDHGYMNHRTGLWDSCTRVPLVIAGPGIPAGLRSERLVDARDVAATIFALADAMPPAGSGGRDLRTLVGPSADPTAAIFMEGVMDMVSVRTNTHRLIYRGPSLGSPDYIEQLTAADVTGPGFVLYDLRDDPEELRDRRAEQPAVLSDLRDRLVDWRRGLRSGDYILPQDQVSAEAAESLRRHGYWDAVPTKATDDASAAARQEPTKNAQNGSEVPKPVRPMDNVDAYCGERWRFLDGEAP